MQSWWISETIQSQGAPALVSWIVLVVGSIVIHELAHGWMAIRCGDDVPLHTGHMTINPFVHIPPMAWIMFVLVGFTWGLMPTNPNNYKGRYDEAKVAFAGPASNIVLAVFFALCTALMDKFGGSMSNDALRENLTNFFWIGTRMNVILAMFNMLPVPPLDGFRVLACFFPKINRAFSGERAQIALVIVMLLVISGGFRVLAPYATEAARWMIGIWSLLF